MAQFKDRVKCLFHNKSHFDYRPLNPDRREIRLLHLKKSYETGTPKSETVLRCKLKHVSLLKKPKAAYYAISYCLGKNPPLRKIILDGHETLAPESAIKTLQTVCHPVHGKRDLPVWIDAICINQGDGAEKSHQVAMMGDVYAAASEVLVYLGDEDDTTEAGLQAIQAVTDAHSKGIALDRQFFEAEQTWIDFLGSSIHHTSTVSGLCRKLRGLPPHVAGVTSSHFHCKISWLSRERLPNYEASSMVLQD